MDAERYTQIRDRITGLYDLCGRGRWEEVEGQLTDEFLIIEAESLPFGGEDSGKKALQELYSKVFAFWEDPSLDIGDITIAENNAVVLITMYATSRYNGQRLTMKLCEVFHMRGDRFCGITPYYFDTVAIARATGTLREPDAREQRENEND